MNTVEYLFFILLFCVLMTLYVCVCVCAEMKMLYWGNVLLFESRDSNGVYVHYLVGAMCLCPVLSMYCARLDTPGLSVLVSASIRLRRLANLCKQSGIFLDRRSGHSHPGFDKRGV